MMPAVTSLYWTVETLLSQILSAGLRGYDNNSTAPESVSGSVKWRRVSCIVRAKMVPVSNDAHKGKVTGIVMYSALPFCNT